MEIIRVSRGNYDINTKQDYISQREFLIDLMDRMFVTIKADYPNMKHLFLTQYEIYMSITNLQYRDKIKATLFLELVTTDLKVLHATINVNCVPNELYSELEVWMRNGLFIDFINTYKSNMNLVTVLYKKGLKEDENTENVKLDKEFLLGEDSYVGILSKRGYERLMFSVKDVLGIPSDKDELEKLIDECHAKHDKKMKNQKKFKDYITLKKRFNDPHFGGQLNGYLKQYFKFCKTKNGVNYFKSTYNKKTRNGKKEVTVVYLLHSLIVYTDDSYKVITLDFYGKEEFVTFMVAYFPNYEGGILYSNTIRLYDFRKN